MSPIRFIKSRIRLYHGRRELREALRQPAPGEIQRADWPESLRDPTAFYFQCVRYFYGRLPAEFRRHREYFNQERRGFGEDAFHVMWFLLFRELRPRDFLEIGVYRGQTLSLASLLQRHFGWQGEVAGISPFSSAGDSVSKYLNSVDYLEDTLKNFAHFGLPAPTTVKAFSTDDLAREKVRSRQWDCAYIDGNHEYEIARADWDLCSANLKPGGIIVLDDSALSTTYRAPNFATAGHPGPSKLATEVKSLPEFEEILQVGHNRVFQKRARQ